MIAKLVYSKIAPLTFINDHILVCNRGGDIYLLDVESETITKTFTIKISPFKRFAGKNKALYRFFRCGVRAVEQLADNVLLLSVGNKLLELNISSGYCTEGFDMPRGIRPLNFTKINSIIGFDDAVVFGGYLSNPNKEVVCIYKRVGIDNWEIIYSFEKGSINHIHNIVPDKYNNCIWIFTGDFGEGAAIWKATSNFNKVIKIFGGMQKYRGCAAFATEDGILYATDTPFESNKIYLLSNSNSEHSIKEITEISGSSIYGCQVGNNFLFSSTVESNGLDESMFEFLFGRKRGDGIIDNNVHLYFGNARKGFEDIYNLKKDFLPFSFQFGVFKFPKNMTQQGGCYFQPVSTKKYDQDLLKIELNCD